MTVLEQLTAADAPAVADLITSVTPPDGTPTIEWGNQPTWDNSGGGPWNNAPSWDNWQSAPWDNWNNGPSWSDWSNR
ncbi:multiple cyclophane-containing RiPP AmcA [Kitasatospora sp. NPDC057542]|uniref:multiple cyclophane-containing RiPP AmcA n=1 Tax=Streptomycetaceae TaxID=2062 RepID=UPI001CCB5F2D|nr:multiple cyclophane-containing RiPP AmcA [Streptomyces sp. LS1784]